ncbi:MAG: hypothetical protein M3350_10570 [Actinomycetota bacterium]|nr:hypothetical protein [Actinomycetota bacterium]MDQ3721204.1 hypothetical protein [Actinomycetota bacterium]
MTTIFVSGAVANKHRHGGSVWVRMSWAEGLRDLGFDVVFVEQIDETACVDEQGRPAAFEDSENARVFEAAMAEFGFAGSAALICPQGERIRGMARDELMGRAEGAELLVNISGHLRWAPLVRRIQRRAYIDLDPGFTQIWHAGAGDAAGLEGHELHFTVGENVGTERCVLPTGDIEWRPIRQPVVLDRWPVAGGDPAPGFTTVASWRGAYGRAAWKGRTYGLKAHEFRRFLELPRVTGLDFDVALDIHPDDRADIEALEVHGWRLVDTASVASTRGFQRFVQSSSAEFSAAQGIYVETESGWFSDRTVRYLASGRPALVQDTGLGDRLPVGEGLLVFGTLEEAAQRAREIADDLPRHRAAARRIAEEHFAAERSLAPLLEAAGVAP